MSPDQHDRPADPAGQFEYFMLRLFRAEESPQSIVGQVERLGTGEKRRFETGGELLALVTRWPVTAIHDPAGPQASN
jgi:hypothetical protein